LGIWEVISSEKIMGQQRAYYCAALCFSVFGMGAINARRTVLMDFCVVNTLETSGSRITGVSMFAASALPS
jgi:hypothetical protein